MTPASNRDIVCIQGGTCTY